MNFSDDFILLSYVNTKLRDEFDSLDDLCDSLNFDKTELLARLKGVGFVYNESDNKFVGEI